MSIERRAVRHAVTNRRGGLTEQQADEAHRLLARLDALHYLRMSLDEQERDVVDRLRALVG